MSAQPSRHSTTWQYDEPPVDEWQITFGPTTHVFRDEAKAQAFVEGIHLVWPGKAGGRVEVNIRHICRHLHEPGTINIQSSFMVADKSKEDVGTETDARRGKKRK